MRINNFFIAQIKVFDVKKGYCALALIAGLLLPPQIEAVSYNHQ
jgi:hypothetical protein